MTESYFFIPQFLPRFFSTFPQTPAAHLRTYRVTPVCRAKPVENRCSRIQIIVFNCCGTVRVLRLRAWDADE
jgi:hypothetical protein